MVNARGLAFPFEIGTNKKCRTIIINLLTDVLIVKAKSWPTVHPKDELASPCFDRTQGDMS